jgi:prephenate dehydrogenase
MEDGFAGFKIGVAGLGLIGGSLARAFKDAGFYVAGFDIDKPSVDAAIEDNAIDEGETNPSGILNCDLVFIALYPDGIIDFVTENASRFKKGAVVIDCCGIKSDVCEKLFDVAESADFTFIGGHPMAGTEQNGFKASSSTLFCGASFILTPRYGEDDTLLHKTETLISKAGFGRVVFTTPKHHDRMIAFTSQLPHVIACAYVMSPSCPDHDGYSAGSFRDVARVAHINPQLWSELFTDNSAQLCDEIDIMISNMKSIRDAAAAGDRKTLAALLQNARDIKDSV